MKWLFAMNALLSPDHGGVNETFRLFLLDPLAVRGHEARVVPAVGNEPS